MTNKDRLRALLQDVFLLTDGEFRFDLKREDVDTWDSFGVVSLAVGVQQTFGYHFTPEEASGLTGVADIIAVLESHGIRFDD
ncbi:MAG TPA: acyl carrier protein [Vicinamibacterales bacterium]|nr:acyl carrier protein [Vicinamibacterales bacterium]